MTRYLLSTFDAESIINKRRVNYEIIRSALSDELGVEPLFKELPEGVCPLNFPLVVQDREYLRAYLKEMKIDAGVWWKGYHEAFFWNEYPDACYLKNNVLTLPIHQDMNEREMHYVVDNLVKYVKMKRH